MQSQISFQSRTSSLLLLPSSGLDAKLGQAGYKMFTGVAGRRHQETLPRLANFLMGRVSTDVSRLVALLKQERDEAIARAVTAEKQAEGLKAQQEKQEKELDRLRTGLTDVNNLLMDVPPNEDWRKVVRQKVVDVLFGQPAWKNHVPE